MKKSTVFKIGAKNVIGEVLIGLFVTSFLFLGGLPEANGTITIQAPGSTVEGQTIGNWTAQWWQ